MEYFRPYLTPSENHEWKGARIHLNPLSGSFDAAIVHQSTRDLDRGYEVVCPPTRTLLAVKEPPDICFFSMGFLRQFSGVLCHDDRVPRDRRIGGSAGHHWFVEVQFSQIEPTSFTHKPRLLSAVVSGKTDTVGHRKRLALMHALKEHFGDKLDWWGRGIRELAAPKLTALQDYKYHIAIENGSWPGYWTEKLLDCYVANCVPIYWGAPDVGDYFDAETIVPIDIDDAAKTIQNIEDAIQRDLFSELPSALSRQRKRIVSDYHPYEVYMRALASLPESRPEPITIKPQSAFEFSIGDRVKNRLWRLRNRSML